MKASLDDRDRQALMWRDQRAQEHSGFVDAVNRIDRNNSGSISWHEFKTHLEKDNRELAGHFAALNLDIKSAQAFFKSLQHICHGNSVPVDAFIKGCIRMSVMRQASICICSLYNWMRCMLSKWKCSGRWMHVWPSFVVHVSR